MTIESFNPVKDSNHPFRAVITNDTLIKNEHGWHAEGLRKALEWLNLRDRHPSLLIIESMTFPEREDREGLRRFGEAIKNVCQELNIPVRLGMGPSPAWLRSKKNISISVLRAHETAEERWNAITRMVTHWQHSIVAGKLAPATLDVELVYVTPQGVQGFIIH